MSNYDKTCKACVFQKRITLWIGIVGAVYLAIKAQSPAPLVLIPLWAVSHWITYKFPLPQLHHELTKGRQDR